MISIRPALESDAGGIADCVDHAYSPYIPLMGKLPGPMTGNYPEVIQNHEVHVAVTESGEVAGMLVLIAMPETLLLDNVAVRPVDQNRGIGRRLMNLAEQRAVQLGYGDIELYTHLCMVGNQAIYSSMGYVESRRVTESGYDRIYFRKQLG